MKQKASSGSQYVTKKAFYLTVAGLLLIPVILVASQSKTSLNSRAAGLSSASLSTTNNMTSLASFAQYNYDFPTQFVVASDTRNYSYRDYRNGSWGSWKTYPVSNLAVANISTIKSWSVSKTPTGSDKVDALTSNGDAIWTAPVGSDRWTVTKVIELGLPGGISSISSFNQSLPDSASSNYLKQTVVSGGNKVHYRFYKNGKWDVWNTISVSTLGIPNVSSIRSLSFSKTPDGKPKLDATSSNGLTLYSCLTANGGCATYLGAVAVSSLNIPAVNQGSPTPKP